MLPHLWRARSPLVRPQTRRASEREEEVIEKVHPGNLGNTRRGAWGPGPLRHQ